MSWSISYYQRNKSVKNRFWEKVDIRELDDCWEWKASKNKKGYGNFYISVGNSKDLHQLAHRFSWKLCNGEIPDGLYVCHKCDNPSCVNPNHLFLGNNQDNMNDMKIKNRSPRMQGSRHPEAKLDENKVKEIKSLRKDGNTLQSIADKYKVNVALVHRICKGVSWSHVDE